MVERPEQKTALQGPAAGTWLAYWICFVLVAATAGLLSFYSPLREASSIILFVPLIWGFMILSQRGIVAVTVLLALLRVGVEIGLTWSHTGEINILQAAGEPIFPILLYIALAVAFIAYRERQLRLMQRIIRMRTREQVVRVADGLAHDFNNILTAIAGLAELLAEDDSLGTQARQDVQSILDSARQGKGIVRRLRTFTNGGLYEFTECDLSDVVAHHLPLIRRILPASVAIETSYADQPLHVLIDAAQLHRLLLNLCLNASTAMGGEGTVRLSTRRTDSLAHLTISDTGPGIASQDLERIFEPEFTTRQDIGGSGMGLDIVRRIADAHKGSIQCCSTPGQGASFDLALPCRDVAETREVPSPPQPAAVATP